MAGARSVLLVAAIGAAACGSGPAAPALPPLFVIAEGPHTLTISVWTPTHTNPYGFSSSQLVCSGVGATSAAVPVTVRRDGAVWDVRADTGTLTLRLAGASAGHEGTMAGEASGAGVTVVINDGTFAAPAVLPPGAASATSVGGRIEGHVTFSDSRGAKSCSANAWTLSSR